MWMFIVFVYDFFDCFEVFCWVGVLVLVDCDVGVCVIVGG